MHIFWVYVRSQIPQMTVGPRTSHNICCRERRFLNFPVSTCPAACSLRLTNQMPSHKNFLSGWPTKYHPTRIFSPVNQDESSILECTNAPSILFYKPACIRGKRKKRWTLGLRQALEMARWDMCDLNMHMYYVLGAQRVEGRKVWAGGQSSNRLGGSLHLFESLQLRRVEFNLKSSFTLLPRR
jgi:hypothetical protein